VALAFFVLLGSLSINLAAFGHTIKLKQNLECFRFESQLFSHFLFIAQAKLHGHSTLLAIHNPNLDLFMLLLMAVEIKVSIFTFFLFIGVTAQ
jgi:hypothetical protein